MVPGLGVQVGEGLAETALAAVTGLVLNVLCPLYAGIFCHNQIHIGSHNQLPLDAKLAVNGHILCHGDSLALGNAGAIVIWNIGLAVPAHSGEGFQVMEGHCRILLAVEHRHNLGIAAEGIPADVPELAVQLYIGGPHGHLVIILIPCISGQRGSAQIGERFRQMNGFQRRIIEGTLSNVGHAVRQVNGGQGLALHKGKAFNPLQGGGQRHGGGVDLIAQAIPADGGDPFSYHNLGIAVAGKGAFTPVFHGSRNLQGIHIPAEASGSIPTQVGKAVGLHGFQTLGDVDGADIEHLVKGPLADVGDRVREGQLPEAQILEEHPGFNAGDGVGLVIALAVGGFRHDDLLVAGLVVEGDDLDRIVRDGHIGEDAVVELNAGITGKGYAVEQNLMAEAATAQGDGGVLGFYVDRGMDAMVISPQIESVLANGLHAAADVHGVHALGVNERIHADGLHAVGNGDLPGVGEPGERPIIDFLELLRQNHLFQAGAIESRITDFGDGLGNLNPGEVGAVPEHTLGNFFQVVRQRRIAKASTAIEDVLAKGRNTAGNGHLCQFRTGKEGAVPNGLQTLGQIGHCHATEVESLFSDGLQIFRNGNLCRDGIERPAVNLLHAVRHGDALQASAGGKGALADDLHRIRNYHGGDIHIGEGPIANGGDGEGFFVVGHRGGNFHATGQLAVAAPI